MLYWFIPYFKWIRRSENYFNSLSKTLSLCYSDFRLILTTATKILKDSNDGFVLDRPTIRVYSTVRLWFRSIKIRLSIYDDESSESKCHVRFFSYYCDIEYHERCVLGFTWVFAFFIRIYCKLKINARLLFCDMNCEKTAGFFCVESTVKLFLQPVTQTSRLIYGSFTETSFFFFSFWTDICCFYIYLLSLSIPFFLNIVLPSLLSLSITSM